jgi:riboflavin transporter FmnP
VSGWDTGALGKLVFFAALIAIILVVIDYMKVDVSQMPIPVSLALVGAAAAGLLFVILRFLFMPDGLSRAWGLYLAIIAAAVLAYGAWLKLQEDA